jgi:Spy/CpxP family protein refolding chaperone
MKTARLNVILIGAVTAFALCASDVCAQPDGQPPGGQRPGGQQRGGPGGGPGGRPGGDGFGGRGGQIEDLLRRDDVRKELELLDDQVQALDEITQRQRESGRDLFAGLQDLAPEARDAKMREIFAKREAEMQQELDKVLLPHQSDRLKQLVAQYRARGGVTQAIFSGDVATQLGISEEKQEELRQVADELRKELDEKMRQLRKDVDEQFLAKLTPQQQAQWKEIMGEPFEFQGGGPGGPGDRGGPPRGPGDQAGQPGGQPRGPNDRPSRPDDGAPRRPDRPARPE